MAIPSPNQVDVLNVMDVTYGLVDGSTTWPDCLEALVRLASLDGASLRLYDCAQGQSQVIETKGQIGPSTDLSANSASMDDFLWRSRPGTFWQPSTGRPASQVQSDAASGRETKERTGSGYAVIDRDRAHILYLAFLSNTSHPKLDYDTVDLLQSLLPHVHRACRLYRSLHGNALITLVDPDHAASTPSSGLPIEHRLRRRFQLSKAEARVAKLLAEGLAPRMIADRLHVSVHTVRSQLQAIFQKTETSRQAELTSLLLRETEIPTAICRTPPADLDNQERSICL